MTVTLEQTTAFGTETGYQPNKAERSHPDFGLLPPGGFDRLNFNLENKK